MSTVAASRSGPPSGSATRDARAHQVHRPGEAAGLLDAAHQQAAVHGRRPHRGRRGCAGPARPPRTRSSAASAARRSRVSIAHSKPSPCAVAARRARRRRSGASYVATARLGDRLPTARWTRTASTSEAPRPPYSAGTSSAGPPASRKHRQRVVAGRLELEQRDLARGPCRPRGGALQAVSRSRSQEPHAAARPAGAARRADDGDRGREQAATMATVFSSSVRAAIGSRASARLGMPMSSRASKSIRAPVVGGRAPPGSRRTRRGRPRAGGRRWCGPPGRRGPARASAAGRRGRPPPTATC